VKERDSRRNRYQIEHHLPLPEAIDRNQVIGEVLAVLAGTEPGPKAKSRWGGDDGIPDHRQRHVVDRPVYGERSTSDPGGDARILQRDLTSALEAATSAGMADVTPAILSSSG
jgi:hypothetical protein